MKALRRFALLAVIPWVAAAPAAEATDLEAAFNDFYQLELAEGALEVRDRVLIRPDAVFKLKEGVFIPAKPLEGVATGGVFLGKGEVTFRPSQAPDRRVLSVRMQEWLGRPGTEYKGDEPVAHEATIQGQTCLRDLKPPGRPGRESRL